jgi:CHAT domain-containing protein
LAAGAIVFQAVPGRTAPAPADRPMIVGAALPVVANRAGFRALPATGPEAQAARDLYRAAFVDEPAEVLLKDVATEAELKRRVDGGRWRVLHLATHGVFESPARIAALRADIRLRSTTARNRLTESAMMIHIVRSPPSPLRGRRSSGESARKARSPEAMDAKVRRGFVLR